MKRYAIDVRSLRELPDGNWREATKAESDDEGGEWVRFDDVAKLEAEHEVTIKRLQQNVAVIDRSSRLREAAHLKQVRAELPESLKRNAEGVDAANALLTDEVDRLEAECERMAQAFAAVLGVHAETVRALPEKCSLGVVALYSERATLIEALRKIAAEQDRAVSKWARAALAKIDTTGDDK